MFTGRKLPLTLAFVVLVALAFGASCKGFFVDDTLTAVAIQPPTPQVNVGSTETLQAWGTFSPNGNRKKLTSDVAWSVTQSGSDIIATIDPKTGLLTGVTPGTATVTASSQGLSGTATATVIGNVTSIGVSPTSGGIQINGDSITFTFAATPGPPNFITASNGGTLTITPSDTSFTCTVGTDSSNNPAEVCSATNGATSPYTIQMSYPSTSGGTVTSPTATVTVSP